MKLNIGDNIKRLRKEKDITQEEFAEMLGVSCQSVSRWENNCCYPDIEFIPEIAAFFGISTDKLLGVDETTEKKDVERYLNDFQAAISVGNIDECIRIARLGVGEYPNNYTLLNKLMYAMFVAGSDDADIPNWRENQLKYDAEIVAIGERIMKYCPDPDIKNEAACTLAFNHCEMGRREQGRKIYEKLPRLNFCQEQNIWWSLNEDEKLDHARMLIYKAYGLLSWGFYRLIFLVNDKDAIKIIENNLELEKMMFDGEIVESKWSWAESKMHYLIAERYLKLNDVNNAMKHLDMCVNAAVSFDNRPEDADVHSLLLGEKHFSRINFDTADSRPLCEILRDTWLAKKEFDSIRNTDEFKAIIEKLG